MQEYVFLLPNGALHRASVSTETEADRVAADLSAKFHYPAAKWDRTESWMRCFVVVSAFD